MQLVIVLLLGLSYQALAHSWLDCTDWRFNNAGVRRFNDTYGTCAGFPRRYPPSRMAYGTYDGYRYYRHYEQDPNRVAADDAAPCSQFDRKGNDGVTLVGSDERRGNPVSIAYSPNKDPDNYNLGAITSVTVGQELCWRWPAKNHAGHVNDQNMVSVNWATTANSADPTQRQLNTMTVASMRFRNCPDPGVPNPASDQTGVGSDRMPCGGCFTVPARSPGTYLVQWRWMLNPGEWYASCSDIQVVAGPTSQALSSQAQTSQAQSTTRASTSQNQQTSQQQTSQGQTSQGQTSQGQTSTPESSITTACGDASYCTNICGVGNVDTCTCEGNQFQVKCVTGASSIISVSLFLVSVIVAFFM